MLADTRRGGGATGGEESEIEDGVEYYRLRSFSITANGVFNLGDSLKTRRSRSINSVTSSTSCSSTREGRLLRWETERRKRAINFDHSPERTAGFRLGISSRIIRSENIHSANNCVYNSIRQVNGLRYYEIAIRDIPESYRIVHNDCILGAPAIRGY